MSSPAQPSDDRPETAPVPESPLHPVSLLAGAASAAAAAIIGGRLGLSGTVVGAAVGSIVATVAATTVKHWGFRGRDAVLGVTRRAAAASTPGRNVAMASTWRHRAALAGGGFALGIVALLGVQLALGTSLSRGSGQLQEAATRVVAPTGTTTHRATVRTTPSPPTSAPTPAAPATGSTTPSPSALDPVKAPASTAVPSPSPSATPASPSPSATPS